MIHFPHIRAMRQALGGVINKVTAQRAVLAQAQQNGGAMNTSAQSSVQTATEKALKTRRDALLGHPASALVTAPEAPHLEPQSEEPHHSPADPRYRFRRKGGQHGQGGQKGHR